MPRLESKKRNQFWEVLVQGNTTLVRFGSLGTDGKTVPHQFPDPQAAQADAQSRIASKLQVGYDLINPLPQAAKCPVNPELEAALLASPKNEETALVYADWLQNQGDPRGELIMVQHARAQAPSDKALAARERALFRAHWPHFWPRRFGELVRRPRANNRHPNDYCSAKWSCGFMSEVTIGHNLRPRYTLRELISELFEHPSARFLSKLTLGGTVIDDPRTFNEALSALLIARPRALSHLRMFDTERPVAWLDGLDPLYLALPRLRSLELIAWELNLGKPTLPHLEHLSVRAHKGGPKHLQAILREDWPDLYSLSVDLSLQPVPSAELRALRDGGRAPHLCDLSLRRTTGTASLLKSLVGSSCFERLELLDLSWGTLTDGDVDWLIDCADMFKHLSWLELSGNHISPKAMTKLQRAGIPVLSKIQYPGVAARGT